MVEVDARYLNALEDWEKNISPKVRNPFLKDPNYFIKDSNNRDHIFLNSQLFKSLVKDKLGSMLNVTVPSITGEIKY